MIDFMYKEQESESPALQFFVNLRSHESIIIGDCTNCGAKGVSILQHECTYKDGLGHEYHVPAHAVPEFERRRTVLLTIKVILLSCILAGLLYWSWTHQ